jgi:hypothetical protein
LTKLCTDRRNTCSRNPDYKGVLEPIFVKSQLSSVKDYREILALLYDRAEKLSTDESFTSAQARMSNRRGRKLKNPNKYIFYILKTFCV